MLHDLALELGQPLAELSATTTERTFRQWLKYREQRLFPTDRIVLQLAQLTYWVARVAGIEDAQITDYLMERAPDDDEDGDLDAAKEFFGFAPRK